MPDSQLELEPTYDTEDPAVLLPRLPEQTRQGSLGENSLGLRYLPSDEMKDQVAHGAHATLARQNDASTKPRARTTSPPSLRVKRLTQTTRRAPGRPPTLSTGIILLFAAISLVSTGYKSHHATDEPQRGAGEGTPPRANPALRP